MARLSPQQKRFLDLLRSMRSGDQVSRQQILEATGWEPKSFDTNVSKNKFVEFLDELPDRSFRVLLDGSTVTADAVQQAMTQVNAQTLTLHKGDVLAGEDGTYVLEAELGAGAVAQVWSGTDTDRAHAAAIKVALPRPDLLDPTRFADVRARFRKEAHQGRALEHDCIVRIVDHGEFRSHPFIVMELAKRSLGKRLKSDGPLSVKDSLAVIRRCATGLRFLHGHGCVHRDIKPDNLLETERGVVVADLGIVRWGDLNPAFTSAATMTRASVQLGSWFYMAPEQQQSPHEAVPASDIYSLGVSWYELLTKSPPSPAQLAAKKYPPASDVPAVNEMIGAMTNFDPKDRPDLERIEAEVMRLIASQSV